MDPSLKEWEKYENPQESVLCKRIVGIMRKGISPEQVAKLYSEWAEDMIYDKVSDFANCCSVIENDVAVDSDGFAIRVVITVKVVLLMVVLITINNKEDKEDACDGDDDDTNDIDNHNIDEIKKSIDNYLVLMM